MKLELGRCLLMDRLDEANMTIDQLAQNLLLRPERLIDLAENKRIMSLKIALSIADTIGCEVGELYETLPFPHLTFRPLEQNSLL
ncbi:helix-turn-helix domain-containing protein [Paenibacillus terrigena]|uniref:helix-turn-helix domain-containing protein n=1 Tax=Paenibacillus terrigena TaxID=369333 RepID=UPI00035E3F36|nr:helix-turn-helix transcriptional regulator [Paenibacillus terrigena]